MDDSEIALDEREHFGLYGGFLNGWKISWSGRSFTDSYSLYPLTHTFIFYNKSRLVLALIRYMINTWRDISGSDIMDELELSCCLIVVMAL